MAHEIFDCPKPICIPATKYGWESWNAINSDIKKMQAFMKLWYPNFFKSILEAKGSCNLTFGLQDTRFDFKSLDNQLQQKKV